MQSDNWETVAEQHRKCGYHTQEIKGVLTRIHGAGLINSHQPNSRDYILARALN